ncbi:hypothetical protein LguiB_014144 [Lonicera macranthoides]
MENLGWDSEVGLKRALDFFWSEELGVGICIVGLTIGRPELASFAGWRHFSEAIFLLARTATKTPPPILCWLKIRKRKKGLMKLASSC